MVTQAVQAELRISPYARRLAAQRGIPVADLVGTGPGGEVVAKDVRRAGATRYVQAFDQRHPANQSVRHSEGRRRGHWDPAGLS